MICIIKCPTSISPYKILRPPAGGEKSHRQTGWGIDGLVSSICQWITTGSLLYSSQAVLPRSTMWSYFAMNRLNTISSHVCGRWSKTVEASRSAGRPLWTNWTSRLVGARRPPNRDETSQSYIYTQGGPNENTPVVNLRHLGNSIKFYDQTHNNNFRSNQRISPQNNTLIEPYLSKTNWQ